MNGRSLSLCFNVEGLRVTLWPRLTLLPPSRLLWEDDDSSDRLGLLRQPILQAISLDWVENFNSGVKYEEVQCGPESEPAAICNKSDELICIWLTPRVSHHWLLTQERKRCIIYCSPAKPPTSAICTVLYSLQRHFHIHYFKGCKRGNEGLWEFWGGVINFSWGNLVELPVREASSAQMLGWKVPELCPSQALTKRREPAEGISPFPEFASSNI